MLTRSIRKRRTEHVLDDIFTEDQVRALQFVSAANRGGHRPTEDELMQWITHPAPKASERGPLLKPHRPGTSTLERALANMLAPTNLTLDRAFRQLRQGAGWIEGSPAEYGPDIPAETFTDHLLRLGWLESTEPDSLSVTALGRALLRSVMLEDSENIGAETVILGRDDALAYPKLIHALAEAGDGLVVDPYARVDQLLPILQSTSISRVLVSDAVNQSDRVAMGVLIQSGVSVRPFELRSASKGALHDRYIVGETIRTIGTSMATVGGKYTTILSPLPEVAADEMRSEIEAWWSAAQPVATFPPARHDNEEPKDVDATT